MRWMIRGFLFFAALNFEHQEAQAQTYHDEDGSEDSSVKNLTGHFVVFSCNRMCSEVLANRISWRGCSQS